MQNEMERCSARDREVIGCLQDVDRVCMAGAGGASLTRWDCYNLQTALWTEAREAARLDLVSLIRDVDEIDEPTRSVLLASLDAAHQGWIEHRYDDCAFRANMWFGSQRLHEDFLCPMEAEAGRTLVYTSWRTRLTGGEAPFTDAD